MPVRPTEPAGFNCLGKRSQPDSVPGRGPGDRSGFNSCKGAMFRTPWLSISLRLGRSVEA